jgi:hypothetical protein
MQHCRETRLDIDPRSAPDIVADMANLPGGIGPYDAVFASHCLEHLPFNKIQPCLKGWLNVLRPGGAVVLFLPDLEELSPTDDVLYTAPCGAMVKARDLFYGHSELIEENPYMQHLSGFTSATLRKQLEDAGFVSIQIDRAPVLNLFAVGIRP